MNAHLLSKQGEYIKQTEFSKDRAGKEVMKTAVSPDKHEPLKRKNESAKQSLNGKENVP